MKRTGVYAAACLLAAAGSAAADGAVAYLPAAAVSQPWLGISTDPRAAAMGEALVAGGSEGFSLNNNPAGLGLLFDTQLSLAHNEWYAALGLRQEYFAFSRRLGNGGLGVALNYFSYGSFEDRDASGAVVGGSLDSAYSIGLGYAGGLLADRLQLGLDLELAQESLGTRVGSAVTGGLGALYQLLPGLRLGGYVSHFGVQAPEEGQAPTAFHGGLAWQPLGRTFMLVAQATRPARGSPSLRLGGEWRVLGQYSLRAGWRATADPAEPDQGFSAGAGLRMGSLSLDYAYVPYGELTKAHRVAATLELSEGLFGGNIVIESYGVTQNAQAEYSEGKAAFERRDWYVAKVAFNRSLKAFPGFSKAAEIKRLLQEMERHIAADKSRGLTLEVRQKLARRVEEARRAFAAGEFMAPRRELEAVLEFDSGMKEALALLKQIQSSSARKVDALRQEAFAALARGDLATGVSGYRQILKVDDSDAESISRLRKLRPRILLETKRMHRQGIDYYVTSNVERAVFIWEKALELEPSDPHNIRRDLDKARKLLELRAGK